MVGWAMFSLSQRRCTGDWACYSSNWCTACLTRLASILRLSGELTSQMLLLVLCLCVFKQINSFYTWLVYQQDLQGQCVPMGMLANLRGQIMYIYQQTSGGQCILICIPADLRGSVYVLDLLLHVAFVRYSSTLRIASYPGQTFEKSLGMRLALCCYSRWFCVIMWPSIVAPPKYTSCVVKNS